MKCSQDILANHPEGIVNKLHGDGMFRKVRFDDFTMA